MPIPKSEFIGSTPNDEPLTPEQLKTLGSDMFKVNLRTLSRRNRREVGQILTPLYATATDEEPALRRIMMRCGGSRWGDPIFQPHHAFATHKGFSSFSRFELNINTDGGLDYYKKVLHEHPQPTLAGKLGIDSSDVTPELYASFTFLHELGHIVDWVRHAPDRASYNERAKEEMHSLPIPDVTPTELARLLAKKRGKKWFEQDKDFLKQIGIDTPDALADFQAIAYRSMGMEDQADEFAIKILLK